MGLFSSLKRQWNALKYPDQGSRTPVDVDIKPRRMGFTLEQGYRNNWAHGDPIKTHFMNALSCILPMGEEFFLETMRNYRDLITDEKLKQDARYFCGQEGHHAFEHRKFNDLLKAQGYPGLEKLDTLFLTINDYILGNSQPTTQFSFTTGAEHLTSIMSHAFLSDSGRWVEDYDEIAAMLIWHTVEEIEHKSVCFDVYQHVDGNYARRLYGFSVLSLWIASAIFSRQMYLLYKDGELSKPSAWKDLALFYFGTYKDNKPGLLPLMFKDYVQYFRPDFHPWQVDDRFLIKRWQDFFNAGNDVRSVSLAQTTVG